MWRDYIEKLKAEYIGKQVIYDGNVYNIVAVDYNGIIHIDKPAKFTETTAVYTEAEAKKNLL